jgi:hypothetical protein
VANRELVDLPGAGEAGLNIDVRFLQDLKKDVDVLLYITLPSESKARAIRAKALRDDIADALLDLRERYIKEARSGKPIREIDQGVAEARKTLDGWAKLELSSVNDEGSLLYYKKLAGDPDETPSDACIAVRMAIRQEFGKIDSSLNDATQRLREQVAAILRARFGPRLVPEGDHSFQVVTLTEWP